MNVSNLSRYALGVCAAAVAFAGCSAGFQPGSNLAGAMSRSFARPQTSENLYVVNDPSSGAGSVTVYAPSTSTPLRTITAGLCYPDWLTFDSSQNLYVANTAHTLDATLPPGAVRRKGTRPDCAASITVYAPGSTSPSLTITNGVENPYEVVVDGSGNLYVPNGYYGRRKGDVTIIDSATGKLLQTIVKGTYNPFCLAVDSSGTLYVGSEGPGSAGPGWVSVYSAGTNRTLLRKIKDGIDEPNSMAIDASRNLYVGNYQSGTVSVYAPGASTPSRTISNGVVFAFSLAFDSAGNLYVADYDTVTVYAAGTTELLRTISNGTTAPYSLAFGSNAYLNVANLASGSSSGSVTEYAPPGDTLAETITDGINNPVGVAFGP